MRSPQIGSRTCKAGVKPGSRKGIFPNVFTLPRSVDEIIIARVHPYMRNFFPLNRGEENEVSFLHAFPIHRSAGRILALRGSRQIEAVKAIDGHDKAAAVKSLIR